MRIYFAGNITVPREEILLKRGGHKRLFSYHYHGIDKEFYDEFKYRLKIIKEEK
jgi:hypothetical protein